MMIELVLEGMGAKSGPGYSQISHHGVPMLVERTDNGEVRIAQLLSTDPMDYLKKEYLPGSILDR